MRLLLFAFCFFCFPTALLAQFTPCFDADITRGCAPLTVSMEDCSGADPSLIFYDFGDGGAPQNVNTYTYRSPGKYTVRQLLNTGAGGAELVKEQYIEVKEIEPIEVELLACSGFGVTVKIVNPYYDNYRVNWGDGNSQTIAAGQEANYNYANASLQNIVVEGYFNGSATVCASVSQGIVPFRDVANGAFTRTETQANGDVVVNIGLVPVIEYVMEAHEGAAWRDVVDLRYDTRTETLTGLDHSQGVRLRLATVDGCSGNRLYSSELPAYFLYVAQQDSTLMLTWGETPTEGFEEMRLFRNGELLWRRETPDTRSFEDFEIVCNQEYCYRLEATYAHGEAISQEICLTARSTARPPAVQGLRSSIAGGGRVFLQWEYADSAQKVQQIHIRRWEFGQTDTTHFRFSADRQTQSWTDETSQADQKRYGYTLSYTDDCGNPAFWPSFTSPVLLSGDIGEEFMDFSWTDYIGFGNNALYFFEKRNAQGEVLESTETRDRDRSESLDAQEHQAFSVWIRVRDLRDTTRFAYSNIIRVVLPADLRLPTAFTPNGDNLNDDYGAITRFAVQYQLRVYDAWGKVIFYSEVPEERWDGTFRGETLPAGVYRAEAQITDQRGITKRAAAAVQLLR